MTNNTRHYVKRTPDELRKKYKVKMEHQPRKTICCPTCCLPYCWHGLCINNECSDYSQECTCETVYGPFPSARVRAGTRIQARLKMLQ